jgi:hypothetical protein
MPFIAYLQVTFSEAVLSKEKRYQRFGRYLPVYLLRILLHEAIARHFLLRYFEEH